MPNKLLSCGAALAAVCASAASAQPREMPPYVATQRPDLPAVNPRRYVPPPGEGMNRVFQAFGDWSRSHGRPRILLFWNRELDDETTTRYRDHTEGAVATAVRPGIAVTSYDETREAERTTGGKYTGMGSRSRSSDYETGFVNAFVRSGANVVDRNALMRKVSSRHGQDDRSDQQFIESLALEQGVDYLVEVLPDYDSSPTGYMFTVKVTHLPTSQVKAQFRTNGLPENGPSRLVARPGGYERETENRNTPEHVAETLAADTMRRFF